MGRVEPLNSKALKALRLLLEEQYGYTADFDYIVFSMAEDKLFISNRQVEPFLQGKLRIERAGIYFGQEAHGELRLSIEGSQIIGPHAKKNVIELTAHQRDEWMLGKDVQLSGEHEQTFHIVKCGEDFMGCGKYKAGILQNYVPKERYVGAVFTDDDILE